MPAYRHRRPPDWALVANALLGGSAKSIALQPLSVQGQEGLNVAVGVAELRLRPGA